MKTNIIKLTRNQIKELIKPNNLLEFNRDILPKHIASMYDSIESCGILRLPILGNINKFDKRELVIIDGQHLLSAWIKTKKSEINCIIKEYNNKNQVITDVAKLNNIQKSWNDENYLNAWYRFGKDNVEYFSNYSYLYNIYNDVYDGLPIGYLVDLYANSKECFREGRLEFRDRNFSDKIASIAYMLKDEYEKGAFTLQGLRVWAFERKFQLKKDIDFIKLKSRLKVALRNEEDHKCNAREDFKDLVDTIYKRV